MKMKISSKDIFIGVDIGGTNIRCATISKSRKIISYKEIKIKNTNSKEKVIKQLTRVIDSLFIKKIKGIGIGVPSIMDSYRGVVYEANNIPSWKKIPLKKILEKRYKVDILMNNDANCFALGEKHFGVVKGYKHIVGVIIGTGFGAGIIINSKLYRGSNCAAGEFGEIPFKDKTMEDYCSGKFFNMYGISGEELHEMAKKGNKKALMIFKEFGENLGCGIATIINSVDPEIVILGGGVTKSYSFFKNSFLNSLEKHVYRRVFRNIKIKISTVKNVSLLGAVSLFYEK